MTGYRWRHARLALGAALMAAMAACGGGGGEEDPSNGDPTSPPPPPPPPPSAAAFAGGWTGTTSQGKQFAMIIEDAGVALIMIGYGFNVTGCSTGIVSFHPFESPTPPLAVANASFTTTVSGTLGSRTVTGSLAATTANGTLMVVDTQCGVVNSTWSATKASGATANLTGTWLGTFRSSLVPSSSGTLSLVQSGATLSGTYSVPSTGAGGTVAGTVFGQTARFTLTQTAPAGCPGTFTGHAVLLPGSFTDVLFFFYAGTDCLGIHTAGNGSGTKQP